MGLFLLKHVAFTVTKLPIKYLMELSMLEKKCIDLPMN